MFDRVANPRHEQRAARLEKSLNRLPQVTAVANFATEKARAHGKASAAIESLLRLQPPTARVDRDGPK